MNVYCVLKSGGIYTPEWVYKLQRGVRRHLNVPHRFVCLTDMTVTCDSIELPDPWPNWWAKICLFKPGIIEPPAIYLDLDNVVVRDISRLTKIKQDFAMLADFNKPQQVSSCVMWFGKEAPAVVYDRFREKPDYWMKFHETHRSGPYLGDQAFIWDALDRNIPFIDIPRRVIAYYRRDVMQNFGALPGESIMVAFGGPLKPHTVRHEWLKREWA